MSNVKELQTRINSVRDTEKITKAMYMISSMKLRKAKSKLDNAGPFLETLHTGIIDVLLHFPEMKHRLFDETLDDIDEKKTRGFIIVTGDKGMAGAYNHNIIKQALSMITKEDKLYVVGEVGRHVLHNAKFDLDPDFLYSATNPSLHRARIIGESILEQYRLGTIDEVYVIYTEMVNSMRSEVITEKILPLYTKDFLKQDIVEKRLHELGYESREQLARDAEDWVLFYPSPEKVLDKLIRNYTIAYMYGILVESSASEENARMMAMQAATDNADQLLADLSIQYNRARQQAITQEITEVIAGAKALKKKRQKADRRKEIKP